MPQPLPFPAPWSTPLPSGRPAEARSGPRRAAPSLVSAVAAVVAVAAARCRSSGELAALRDAIDRVLADAARAEDEERG